MARITALVPAFNEAAVIDDCLASVAWADEVFVVDSFSTDGTPDIARRRGARVIRHEYVNSATQKNWAIPQASNEWVLVVDADERVTPELRREIAEVLARGGDGCAAFSIPRRNFFLGREIRHAGWDTDRVTRLFLRDRARYPDLHVHADLEVNGKTGRLRGHLEHLTYRSLDQYFVKFRRYTAWSAEDLQRQGKAPSWVNLSLRPLARFLKMYVLRRGFLDGRHGLVLCALAAMSVFTKYALLWEKRLPGPRPGSPPDAG